MDIKRKAINSGKWVTISTVFQALLQFGQIAVLARFLSPTEFGIVAIANIIISFFSIFANLGFTNSIIYKQEKDQKVLSTVFYVNIILGFVIFLIIYFSSPFVVSFYGEPRVSKVLNLSSLVFLFVYLGSVHAILLKKELRFRSVAFIDIFGNLIGTSLMIYLAINGYKELSLVYGGLLTHFIRTILEIYFGRDLFFPKLYFRIGEIKDHLKFGLYNFGENLVSYIESNWDNIIIGKILGPKYLGIYTLAIQLAVYPITKLNPVILQVAYPIIAKLKDDPVLLKRVYLKILDILSYFNFPLLAGLFITVESVVPLVYGPGWEETFPLIRIFVFVSAIGCLGHPLFTIAYSKGKPNFLFYLNLISLAIKIPLVYYLGKYWDGTGIAYALLISTFIHTTLNFKIVGYLIGNFFSSFLNEIIKPILFCFIMIIIVYLYKTFIGYSGWLHAIAEIGIGGFIYLGFTLLFKYSFSDIKQLRNSL